ncbi:MAG: hypothetical protein AAF196_18115 [Planctomycetota bacterium]
MTIDPNKLNSSPIDQAGGVSGPQSLGRTDRANSDKASSDPAAFGRLLDELRAIGKNSADKAAADVSALDSLQQDLDRADEEYRQVMDLRQRLEDAYRRVAPEE